MLKELFKPPNLILLDKYENLIKLLLILIL